MLGLRPMSRVMRRTFFPSAKPANFSSAGIPCAIPQHELVDEETSPTYNAKYFYPAKPGEIISSHYQLLVKIGWGSRSTVWLARDTTRDVLCSIFLPRIRLKLLTDGRLYSDIDGNQNVL